MTHARSAIEGGRFEIVRKLASGGMAELFLARAQGPEGFEKLVALKRILPHLAANRCFMRRFVDEAKLAALLDHPHIAQVFSLERLDGAYCLTMEYVDGRDLREVLARAREAGHRLPIEHAVLIARDVAAALHHAHERRTPDGVALGIIHRDVSPSNIQISYEGVVKLLDFGIAKASTSTMQTRTGILTGKAGYMSPEQAGGRCIDRRSDIFSLGIVLWELVTGERLYRAENDVETAHQILHRIPPRPSTLRPDCPPELDAIIMRALARPLDRRYATAQQLQLALEALAREHRLDVSSAALAATMHELFERAREPWGGDECSAITRDDVAAHRESGCVPTIRVPILRLVPEPEPEPSADAPEAGVDEVTHPAALAPDHIPAETTRVATPPPPPPPRTTTGRRTACSEDTACADPAPEPRSTMRVAARPSPRWCARAALAGLLALAIVLVGVLVKGSGTAGAAPERAGAAPTPAVDGPAAPLTEQPAPAPVRPDPPRPARPKRQPHGADPGAGDRARLRQPVGLGRRGALTRAAAAA